MFEVDDRRSHYYIGYWIARIYRGRGIVSHIVKRECDRLVGLKPVTADTLISNVASQRVLARSGFGQVASDDSHGYWVREA
jgi:RimJ/RimL family protein N-acetyltransferase